MRPWESADERLDVKQVVQWIRDRRGERVSIPTVHRWMLKGVDGAKLPASRVGGKNWRVAPRDLEAFLSRCSDRPDRNPVRTAPSNPQVRPTPAGVSLARRQQIRAVSEQLRQKLAPQT